MFPSAAHVSPKNKAQEASCSTKWLQSTSYQPQLQEVLPSLDKCNEDKQHKKRRHGRSHSPKATVEKCEREPGAFTIDTSSNPNIYKYGSIYEGEVAKYQIRGREPVVGLNTPYYSLLDLTDNYRKEKIKQNRRKRYFSKKNRVRLAKPGVSPAAPVNVGDVEMAVKLLDTGEVLSNAEQLPYRPPNLQRVADLNKTVYDNPTCITKWIELVEHQLLEDTFGTRNESPSLDLNRRHLIILEKQIAIVERAIAANSGNLRLKLLLAGLRQHAMELVTAGVRNSNTTNLQGLERVANEWSQMVFTHPQNVAIWRAYLAHLRGKFAMFGTSAAAMADIGPTSAFGRIDTTYTRALATLSGIISGCILSHKPNEETAEQTIDLLAEYCQWLAQAGFTERAFSVWQAVIEYVCFCPDRLLSLHQTTPGERRQAFRLFWSASERGVVARFGQPGARGWAVWFSQNGAQPSPQNVGGLHQADSVLGDLEEDWTPSSPTALPRWNQITQQWNGISEAAEDALLRFNTLPAKRPNVGDEKEEDSDENARIQRTQEVGGNLGSRQTRGHGWLGLERTRESVGWLPASVVMPDTSNIEDAGRLTRFEEIEPCLLEIHSNQSTPEPLVVGRRKQRLVLLFLEFLGIWDNNVAKEYGLPADLQLVEEMSSVSCLLRQRINPRQFGFPWLRTGFEAGAGSSNLTCRMGTVIADASLEQASRLFPRDANWASAIGRLRFGHLCKSLQQALANKQISLKAALGIWRKKAKSFLSRAQGDLSLWLAYAKSLAGMACICPPENPVFVMEARKVFASTLKMFPLPPPTLNLALDSQLNLVLPRLRIVYAYLVFEFDTKSPPSASVEGAFNRRAVHLLCYAATGGIFTPSVSPADQPARDRLNQPRDLLAESGSLLERRLDALCCAVESATAAAAPMSHAIADLAGILASLTLHLQLLTLGENKLASICNALLEYLSRIDAALCTAALEQRSRWSNPTLMGLASRHFLRLALPSLTAVSVYRHQNRANLIQQFLCIFEEALAGQEGVQQMPPLVTPEDWVFLLPYKVVAAPFGGQTSKTCTIEYQRSLQGLLPPHFLLSFETRLSGYTERVCRCVATHLTANCHLATVGRRKEQDAARDKETVAKYNRALDPAFLLGISSGQQVELLAHTLPSCLDLLCVGLELERWTSLVAGAADNEDSNPMSHCWIQNAVPRIRAAFEKALRPVATNPLVRFATGTMPSLAVTMAPSFWSDHLRAVLWAAYMAFEWNAASGCSDRDTGDRAFDAHRRQRTALKAVFYRAVEDIPWAKVLYTDLARYCPEDVEEVVDLITSRNLRLRTPLEEADLLLTSRAPSP